MKKNLVALAALAVVGAASAQTAVTITGVIGAAYQSMDHNNSKVTPAGNPLTTDGAARGFTLTNADFKLSAVEDLGGGLKAKASVSFETPTSGDSGGGAVPVGKGSFGQVVERRNTNLSLEGNFGSVAFDNTRSSNFLTKGMVAPANLQDGIYDGSGIVNRKGIDVVTYSTKSMNGLVGFVQWAEGNAEVVVASLDGNATATASMAVLGAIYAQGPLAVGAQYKMYYLPELAAGLSYNRKNRLEAFATYDLGVAKVGFGYDGANVGTIGAAITQVATKQYGGVADTTENSVTSSAAYSFGVSVPVGSITLGVNWAKRDINTLTEMVAKYDLSKRTSVNASFGKQSFDADIGAGATSGINGQQYRLGIYHTF